MFCLSRETWCNLFGAWIRRELNYSNQWKREKWGPPHTIHYLSSVSPSILFWLLLSLFLGDTEVLGEVTCQGSVCELFYRRYGAVGLALCEGKTYWNITTPNNFNNKVLIDHMPSEARITFLFTKRLEM